MRTSPLLESLNLKGCKALTDAGVGELSQLSHLKQLNLARGDVWSNKRNAHITETSVIAVIIGCGHLSKVDVTGCIRLDSEKVQQAVAKLPESRREMLEIHGLAA